MKAQVATVTSLLNEATLQIATTLGLEKREARLEARVLAAHAWQVSPAWLIAHDTDPATSAQQYAIEPLLARRTAGEPVAYILGEREFFGLRFIVTPAVLIPRPDTELLVETALQHIPMHAACRILDLGTGSGAIALALAHQRPVASVLAVDASIEALAVAQTNANQLGISHVNFVTGNWYSELATKTFDMIVSNPPYIAAADPHLDTGDLPFEPHQALASGSDGLNDLRVIIEGAPAHLENDGWLFLEHGYDQADAVVALLQQRGFTQTQTWRDLAGLNRVSGGRWLGEV